MTKRKTAKLHIDRTISNIKNENMGNISSNGSLLVTRMSLITMLDLIKHEQDPGIFTSN